MCSRAKAQPSGMFTTGQDLPLFSKTPITVYDRGFAPKSSATQAALPGMPPVEMHRSEELTVKDLPLFEDVEDALVEDLPDDPADDYPNAKIDEETQQDAPRALDPADAMILDAETPIKAEPEDTYWENCSRRDGIRLPIVNGEIYVLPDCLRQAKKTARQFRHYAANITALVLHCADPDMDSPKNRCEKSAIRGYLAHADEIDRQVAELSSR